MKTMRYSENLRRRQQAESYNTKYEREFHKRVSDRREKKLLAQILTASGQHDTILDVPCGAGRLSGVIARHANRLFEVDYSHEMLRLCRTNSMRSGYTALLANSTVFSLPFADRSFDLVVSIRLSHHIPEAAARERYLREICRVAKRQVLFTFFGEESWKNRLRNLRRALGSSKRGKMTLHHRDVRRIAEECGFRWRRSWALAPFFSGHYYALLEREGHY